jgi:uncharacterized protein DUF481
MRFKPALDTDFVSVRLPSILFSILCVAPFVFCATPHVMATPSEPTPDTIVLINGDKVSGRFVSGKRSYVVFEGALTGTLYLKWENVQEIRLANRKLSVERRSSDPTHAKKFTDNTSSIGVTPAVISVATDTGQKALPLKDLQSAVPTSPQPTSFLSQWEGQLQSQNSIVESTQKQYQLGGSLHLGRVTIEQSAFKHQATSLDLQTTFGESRKSAGAPVKTALDEGVIQHNVYFTDSGAWRVFALADSYHNLSLGLNFEHSYGAGVARDWQYGTQIFGLAADARFEGQYLYSPGHSQNLGAAAMSEYYSVQLLKIKNKPLTFLERTTFIPAFEDSHAFQARGLLKLTLPITERFSIGLQENDDYLRNAPHSSKQNYSNTQFTFSYIFGPLRNPQ